MIIIVDFECLLIFTRGLCSQFVTKHLAVVHQRSHCCLGFERYRLTGVLGIKLFIRVELEILYINFNK